MINLIKGKVGVLFLVGRLEYNLFSSVLGNMILPVYNKYHTLSREKKVLYLDFGEPKHELVYNGRLKVHSANRPNEVH